MRKIKIVNIVGTRPNFVKISPLLRQIQKISRFRPILIHTGQHYDKEMFEDFFSGLEIPRPDINLGVENVSCVGQIAKIMARLEDAINKIKPDLVLVVGDVNSTLAGALVSSKLQIPLAHVEAGLRSFDRSMPEEINRIVTDVLSDYLFTTCLEANLNLEKEGIDRKKIFFVGNIMIDSFMFFKKKASALNTTDNFSLQSKGFALITLHRPSNVDDRVNLMKVLNIVRDISRFIPLVFPVHPRTRMKMRLFRLQKYLSGSNVTLTNPLGYLEFLNLMLNAKFILTDSGGIQEEASVIGTPCLTIRENTERPITVSKGTNTLVSTDNGLIMEKVNKIMEGKYKKGRKLELWDGKTAQRIVKILNEKL